MLTYSRDSNDEYLVYYFWLKNRLLIYERIYKRIQDLISIIGGIFGFVTSLFSFVNDFYHSYIILCDTKTLLFSSIEKYEKNLKKNINNINSDNDILISRVNHQQNLELNKSIASVRMNLDKRKLNIINESYNENQNRNNNFRAYFNNNNSTDYIISQKTKANNESKNKLNIVKGDKNKRKENNDDTIDINMKNSYFNYFDYLYENIKCLNKKKNIQL